MANKKLKAPKGTDEVNVGTESYRVDNDQIVEVPEEAVAPLLERGGFTEVDAEPDVPEGFVLVGHPDPHASCGQGEKCGDFFKVPAAIASELIGHGFYPVELKTTTVPPSPFSAETSGSQAPAQQS